MPNATRRTPPREALRQSLRVVHVNAQDIGGDAETVARNLHQVCRARGCNSHLAVGRRFGDDPHTLHVPNGDEAKSRRRVAAWFAGQFPPPADAARQDLAARLARAGSWLAWPFVDGLRRLNRAIGKRLGREDFHFPGTWRLLELAGAAPDIVHLHNLHGDYFDLRALPWLSNRVPVILTLHDAWTFSGHCAHAAGCDRWQTGCGACPDLSLFPAVARDATAFNWRRKQDIFARCRLRVAVPSRWLQQRLRQSIVWPGVVEARVIPHGVDQSQFRPGDRLRARWRLGLPSDADVLLLGGNGAGGNSYKDSPTLRRTIDLLAAQPRSRLLVLVTTGEHAPTQRLVTRCAATQRSATAEVRSIPTIRNPALAAEYYRAADLYLHASRGDAFPLAVVEALSCGTPVVATAVGGISEQVASLALFNLRTCQRLVAHGAKFAAVESATGALVPPGDAAALADATGQLLDDAVLRRRLSSNAERDSARRFSLEMQCNAYAAWYRELAGADAGQHLRAA